MALWTSWLRLRCLLTDRLIVLYWQAFQYLAMQVFTFNYKKLILKLFTTYVKSIMTNVTTRCSYTDVIIIMLANMKAMKKSF